MQNVHIEQVPSDSSFHNSNPGLIILEVGLPKLTKSTFKDYHEYPVTGRDSIDEIDVFRRYSAFEKFRNCLVTRYPGLYIPPIPGKQMAGRKEEATIKERQYFLNLFLGKCCELNYIAQC
jgi:sorting nexin-1/2